MMKMTLEAARTNIGYTQKEAASLFDVYPKNWTHIN